ncbi:MAG TPA: MarR family transcriptional regulator [Rubricoccaceae bacterium]|nr:MarR family transcriptional regulator [Rubricoccaceae bacterium]
MAPSTHATARRLSEAYRPVLRRLGVTRPQYLLLALLWERDGSTPRRLARRLHVSEGAVTTWLAELEATGLVEQDGTATPPDVWLTPRGRALQQQAPQVPSALLCHVLAHLDEEARTHPESH